MFQQICRDSNKICFRRTLLIPDTDHKYHEKLLFLISRLKMFTKYHNCFLSNRFFFYFPFQNKQTEPIRFHYHACHAVRSSVSAFIHSFIHSCIHAFIYLTAWLRYTLISLSNFLHHNVVAIIRPTYLITVSWQ